jgi:nucleotide-binding universal stress UspA family protein
MFEKMIIISEISMPISEMINYINEAKKLGIKKCLIIQGFNSDEIAAEISYSLNLTYIFSEMANKQKELLESNGFEVEIKTVSFWQKNTINLMAFENRCDLILINMNKHTLIGALFLEGAAYHILTTSVIPVLLIKEQIADNYSTASLSQSDIEKHILFPTDFSENAGFAFEFVKGFVRNGVTNITLVHVQDQTKIQPYLNDRLPEFNAIDTKRLLNLKNELMDINEIDVNIQLVLGSPTNEILRIINTEAVSLVIMGTRGRGLVEEIFMGSISHNIARQSPVSVLLIPQSEPKQY